ncbi:polymorphic toxin type 44 domain-containing protein [Pokkaliibacter sp. MBI-7]|uniref:polymorphic toxin type 44 domain-containing protein n=1 Tax=Pokkaliibacter sp. MBI-7 TaxID=3040600 RepID=UPI002446C916|nr:polymorphic toxin type 44 domain-containing protein [Pokkaliibacter sp. MBI-7]MDH2436767.1 polymorphic toxin type 44 domain-containing protein [Pokkaliibacter sp. MBI-7]
MSNPSVCPTPTGSAVTSNPAGQPYLDELTPIAEYMAREISTNLRSRDVRAMKHLNHSADYFLNHARELKSWGLGELLDWGKDKAKGLTAREAAMMIWTMKVAQDSSWDHKPVISRCFHPRDPQEQQYHAWKDRRYFYDIWSNIHYGFIGAASGFTNSQLSDGAGLEQIGSTLFNLKWPAREGIPTGRLRDFDGVNDRKSVQLGIDLYAKYPVGPSAKALVDSILKSNILFYPPKP